MLILLIFRNYSWQEWLSSCIKVVAPEWFLYLGALSVSKSHLWAITSILIALMIIFCLPVALKSMGLPRWLSGKESACSAGDTGSIPVGKILWRRKWQPTPVFLPGNPMDRGTWRATNWGLQRVRCDWTYTHSSQGHGPLSLWVPGR